VLDCGRMFWSSTRDTTMLLAVRNSGVIFDEHPIVFSTRKQDPMPKSNFVESAKHTVSRQLHVKSLSRFYAFLP
jgi:hypothetical protein